MNTNLTKDIALHFDNKYIRGAYYFMPTVGNCPSSLSVVNLGDYSSVSFFTDEFSGIKDP